MSQSCAPATDRLTLPGLDGVASRRRIEQVIWAMVALGVIVRLVRYLLRFPLWGDEAFIAANFLERDYADLMRPLDYHQVAPLFFLWVELTIVKLFGFSEWTLRLFPTACSIASVFLVRHVARRWFPGVPALLAVSFFAVAYYPVRHGNEVKAYAVDLFVALVLLALATEWRRLPRSGWLWALAAIVPVAVGLSLPAVFIAGGISLALVIPLFRARSTSAWLSWVAYNVALVGAFLALYLAVAAGQYEREFASSMQDCWGLAFPPLTQPLNLVRWLAEAHTGRMFAYPVGGKNGASIATFVWFVIAVAVLWRRQERTTVAMVILPMALAFLAAALKRYPYGFSARTMQYLAPTICLMAGMGAAWAISCIPRREGQQRILAGVMVFLVLLGVGSIARDLVKPYKTIHNWKDRAFAQWLWTDKAFEATLVCAKTDLGLDLYPGCYEWGASSLYLCNQRIYSPVHSDGSREIGLDEIEEDHPLRCVVYSIPGMKRDEAAFQSWMNSMQERYRLAGKESHLLNADTEWYHEQIDIYEFVPLTEEVANSGAGDGSTLR